MHYTYCLQIPNCTRFTRYRVDSDLLTPSINLPITDPLLFDGSLSFFLPTDKMTEYSVTLTDENVIDLVFEKIPISEFNDVCSIYNPRRHRL